MTDLLKLSETIVDSGRADEPVNRINQELSELGNGIAVVESFSHCVLFETAQGLVAFDTSGAATGEQVVEAFRGWSKSPLHSVVYTHGHIDHVGGSGAFLRDGERLGQRPSFIGHRRVVNRMQRYRLTNGYNNIINERQFVGMRGRGYGIGGDEVSGGVKHFLPLDAVEPDTTYDGATDFTAGDTRFELRHALGETDDHTWAWVPEHRAICAGDFFIWNFPNCGNPQKVQRYPLEWARAMRDMMAMQPELLLPAHGLPIAGRERIARVLEDVASVLERLVGETLEMMNQGATLNDIVHSVSVDAAELEKPWLRPLYDEPEFVVNNVWRYYGGWYSGEPDRLKPAPTQALAREYAALAGGALALAQRARALSEEGEHRLACHLVETAAQAEPGNAAIHEIRAEAYQQRRNQETSLMAKGIFSYAANESREQSDPQE